MGTRRGRENYQQRRTYVNNNNVYAVVAGWITIPGFRRRNGNRCDGGGQISWKKPPTNCARIPPIVRNARRACHFVPVSSLSVHVNHRVRQRFTVPNFCLFLAETYPSTTRIDECTNTTVVCLDGIFQPWKIDNRPTSP